MNYTYNFWESKEQFIIFYNQANLLDNLLDYLWITYFGITY